MAGEPSCNPLAQGSLVLRTDKLRPGDVLLTDSGGKTAKWIKLLNWGDFSHAAILVSPVEILESHDDRIGHRGLNSAGFLQAGGMEIECVAVPLPCRNATVLRHPNAFSREEFRSAYLATLEAMWGRNYPPWSVVLLASYLPQRLKKLIQVVLQIWEWFIKTLRPNREFQGDFCSQLALPSHV